jgi:hypothetical protein
MERHLCRRSLGVPNDTNPAGLVRKGSERHLSRWGDALGFMSVSAPQVHLQALGLPTNQDIIIALPYLLTLIAVTGLFRKSTPPAGLGRHASRKLTAPSALLRVHFTAHM